MDLNKIREALDSGMPNPVIKSRILSIIGLSDDSVMQLMEVVNSRMQSDKQLIEDSNLEVSRAALHIKSPSLSESSFILTEIGKHYEKYNDRIHCCFNIQFPNKETI